MEVKLKKAVGKNRTVIEESKRADVIFQAYHF